MKRLLIALAILTCSLSSMAARQEAAPWNKVLAVTVPVKNSFGSIDWAHIYLNPSIGQYGGIECEFLRVYPAATCEYFQFQLHVNHLFRIGLRNPTYYRVWVWASCSMSIPANQSGYFYYDYPFSDADETWDMGFQSDYICNPC